MKIFFNQKIQKIISFILIFVIVLPLFIFPKEAGASGLPVADAGNIVQSTINAIKSSATAISTKVTAAAALYTKYKDTILTKIAVALAKQLIRTITAQVVSWINSGFEGSPAFLQNPGDFFLDVADQATGEFLAKNGGPLTALCDPFSIDLKLALNFKYHPKILKRYTCTLGKIIKNTENAVDKATLNGKSMKGFMAGDFRQGGWPAFVSMTTEPQNNVYGAYLTAESELSWRVANAQEGKKEELGAGNGFLSWRDPNCKKERIAHNNSIHPVDEDQAIAQFNQAAPTNEDEAIQQYNEGTLKQQYQNPEDCPINTPGTVIAGSLQNNLNGPLRELELVDSINQIVDALFAQLVTQVLQKGLTGVSKKQAVPGSDKKQSYMDQTTASITDPNDPNFIETKADIIKQIAAVKNPTIEYKKNKEAARDIVVGITKNLNDAKVCYDDRIKIASLSQTDKDIAASNLSQVNSLLADPEITALFTRLNGEVNEAQAKLDKIIEIEKNSNSTTNNKGLLANSNNVSGIFSDESQISAEDIVISKNDITKVTEDTKDKKDTATRLLLKCRQL